MKAGTGERSECVVAMRWYLKVGDDLLLDYEVGIRGKENAPGTSTTRFPEFRSWSRLSTLDPIELPARLPIVRRPLTLNTHSLHRSFPVAWAILKAHGWRGSWSGLVDILSSNT